MGPGGDVHHVLNLHIVPWGCQNTPFLAVYRVCGIIHLKMFYFHMVFTYVLVVIAYLFGISHHLGVRLLGGAFSFSFDLFFFSSMGDWWFLEF